MGMEAGTVSKAEISHIQECPPGYQDGSHMSA